ncbi:MAG: FAD-binding oxidoreductase, partial [Spirulinaceae cyanobacterium RM2_2_10]|nr:FAD-binding oxidoreductase [Spirulinaceae cyanobacterium RM2_2_10]
MSRVAIVGGGVVGAAIAYELSLCADCAVTLLEREQPAKGSTGAALGVLMGAISRKTRGRAWELRQASLHRYDSLIDELQALTSRVIPYNRQGIVLLHFASGADWPQWQKLQAQRQAAGWPLVRWSRSLLQSHCPQLDLDRHDIDGAIYSPCDRQVDPVILTEALLAGAQAKRGRMPLR